MHSSPFLRASARTVRTLLPFALLPASLLLAQSTAPAVGTGAAASETAVELSPFEVRTDRDVGYLATHTLAGSRLNSSLKDTPVIIDVFTKEFLIDIGATTLDDAMLYANNSVVDDGGHSAPTNATSADQLGTYRFISRGISGSRTRNYFETNLPFNLYNTERLDDSRGPNSVLFGIGSAGGTVNNGTKQARPGRHLAEVALQAGSHQSLRSSFDVNVPLRDRAAFRFNAMKEDKNSWRHHLGTDLQAWNPAVTVRPFRQTEIRLDVERGRIGGTTSRNYPANDQISRWLDAGSPTLASLSATSASAAETALGLVRKFTVQRLTWVEEQNFVFNAQNYRTSAPYGQGDLEHSAVIRRPDLYPYDSNPAGPGTRKDQDLGSETLVVEQRLGRYFAFELGYYHEKLDSLKYDLDTTPEVYGDPDIWLRNPTQVIGLSGYTPARDPAGNLLNPNAGRQFMQAIWQRYVDHLDSRSWRATLAWDRDLGRFGAHRAALYGARQEEKTQNWSEREVWSGAGRLLSDDPLNDNNSVLRRRYITPADAASQYFPDPLLFPNLTVNGYPGAPGAFTNTWAQKSGGTHSTRQVDSAMLALQSHWWKRRIATTLGYRLDDLVQTRVDPVRDTTGPWTGTQGVWAFNDTAYAAKRTFSFTGKTHTGGLVLHPHRAVSVFANGSRNLGLPAFTLRVGPDGVAPPPPKGVGLDAGVLVSFADDRIVARVSYFSTKRTDQTASMGVNGFVMTNYNSVLNTLRPYYTASMLAKYDLLRPTAVATGDSLDNENSGFEARLTANLGASLRFNLNYSQSTQERTNVYKRTEAMFGQLDQFIADVQAANRGIDVAQLPTGVATSGLTTIGDTLATTYFDLDGRKVDFESAFGNRKHKANFFGTYAFKEGRLRGAAAGFGARYLSGARIGRVITAPGTPIRGAGAGGTGPGDGTQEPVYSQDSLEYDAMARYQFRRKIGRHQASVSFQLNVRNLLDRQKVQITRYKSNGWTLDRFALYSPREFTLSTRVNF